MIGNGTGFIPLSDRI